jgi:putative PIN family toxin of toxin-antitoxin system
MRVVIDTNVFVSGLRKPYGPSAEIVRMVSSGVLALCHDARVLAEYRDVLHRPKFGFRSSDVDALLEQVEGGGHPVSAIPLPRHLRDRDDEAFLEVALAGGVSYLVTGNLSDYSGHGQQQVDVVSPSQFLERYRKRTAT